MLGKAKVSITQGSISIPDWILWTQVEEVNTIYNSIMEFVLENSTNGLPSTKETVHRKALKVTTFLKVL